MSFFNSIEQLPDDPILGLTVAFKADPRMQKVNLGVGAYKDSEGKSLVLNCVRQAESMLVDQRLDNEYLPIDGDSEFTRAINELIFGTNSTPILEGRCYGIQSIGGTCALRLAGELLVQRGVKQIYLSDPTWPNHKALFGKSGLKVEAYPYYDANTHRLDFNDLCSAIEKMPAQSVILLQAGCHNPTGIDPDMEQWKVLSTLIKKREIFPFFDFAYQGFDRGVDEDAAPIRYFVEQGHEMLVAYSCSKNFGLYGERVGMLSLVVDSTDVVKRTASQLKSAVRGIYSSPALHGARIVKTICANATLRQEWLSELGSMRERIHEMRRALMSGLEARIADRDYSFMAQQRGMFSFSGLSADQVLRLRTDHGIYMLGNGRISVAGITLNNLDHIVEAIATVSGKE